MNMLDISSHQGSFDAEKAKQSGVDHVVLRACYGELEDKCYHKFAKTCKNANLPISAYYFALFHYMVYNGGSLEKAREEMHKEVNAFIALLKSENVTGWAFIDQEMESGNKMGISKQQNTQLLNEAFEIIRKAGFCPALYASDSWISHNLEEDLLTGDFWVAYYYEHPNDPDFDNVIPYTALHSVYAQHMQELGGRVIAWQYGSVGYGNKYGCGSANVDRNILYKLPKEENMEFTPVKNQEYCVKEESKVACQIFNSANVDDVLGNLQRGQVLPITAKGETQAFGSMNGTWYKVLFAGEEKYVVNLDDRSFVRDVVKEKSLHITALNDGDFYDLASTALRYGGVVKLEGFDNE